MVGILSDKSIHVLGSAFRKITILLKSKCPVVEVREKLCTSLVDVEDLLEEETKLHISRCSYYLMYLSGT